jgi:20S proteasome alpha/beta subunit
MWSSRDLLYCALLICILPPFSLAASPYNAYQYDMTDAQFTPDGRLLQVEYASAAADHSSPVVVQPLDSDLCLVCTTHRAGVYTERLVLIPTGSWTTKQPPVVVALSGILADNMALLEVLQEKRWEQMQLYETPLSAQQVAQAMADECQKKAFGGGIRPFGATLLVCGMDGVYQTDPSGGILETSYDNLLRQESQKSVVVGGAANSVRSLKRQLAAVLTNDNIRKQIMEILSLLRSEQKNRLPDKDEMELEAVLISKSRGVLKLTAEQIENFGKEQ